RGQQEIRASGVAGRAARPPGAGRARVHPRTDRRFFRGEPLTSSSSVPGAETYPEVLIALRHVEERADAPLVIGEETEDAPPQDPDIEAEREVLSRAPIAEA